MYDEGKEWTGSYTIALYCECMDPSGDPNVRFCLRGWSHRECVPLSAEELALLKKKHRGKGHRIVVEEAQKPPPEIKCWLPASLHQQLQETARNLGITVDKLMRMMINDHFTKLQKKVAKGKRTSPAPGDVAASGRRRPSRHHRQRISGRSDQG
jgi:hypothetical protein